MCFKREKTTLLKVSERESIKSIKPQTHKASNLRLVGSSLQHLRIFSKPTTQQELGDHYASSLYARAPGTTQRVLRAAHTHTVPPHIGKVSVQALHHHHRILLCNRKGSGHHIPNTLRSLLKLCLLLDYQCQVNRTHTLHSLTQAPTAPHTQNPPTKTTTCECETVFV